MKSIKILALSFVAMSMMASCAVSADNEKRDQSLEKIVNKYGISNAKIDSMSYALGLSYAMMTENYNMSELNITEFTKAYNAYMNGKDSTNPQEVNARIQMYMSQKAEAVAEYNIKEGEEFLAANKTKDSVEVTESGLQYKILAAGSEERATIKDTVLVNYTGKTLDGNVFDTTEEMGEPVMIPLSRVIKGWSEGLQLVGKGGKMVLYIPADLAYGQRGAGGMIGPNSVLVFDVEIVDIHRFVEKEDKFPGFDPSKFAPKTAVSGATPKAARR